MSVIRSSKTACALSLIELLCVIAILAILAALLLPAVAQAKARALRIQCVDHLHEIGIGFISYANEHNGHFPMAVPEDAGGSLESALTGYLIPGDFYFSFRHFQVASNDLVTPRLIVCPADTRLPAVSFRTLENENVSYFIGVNAVFAQPTSILAGDRNLTNDYAAPSTLAQLGANYALRWTEELHRFKGNIVCSDGHVEQKDGFSLIWDGGPSHTVAKLAFPTAKPPAGALAHALGKGYHVAQGRLGSGVVMPAANPSPVPGPASSSQPIPATAPKQVVVTPPSNSAVKPPPSSRTQSQPTNPAESTTPTHPSQVQAQTPTRELAQSELAQGATKPDLGWLCLVLLLLLIGAALGLYKMARTKRKAAAKPVIRL